MVFISIGNFQLYFEILLQKYFATHFAGHPLLDFEFLLARHKISDVDLVGADEQFHLVVFVAGKRELPVGDDGRMFFALLLGHLHYQVA